MPYNPATGGENVILGWSADSQDYAIPQLGPVTNDGAGHQYAQPALNSDTGALINAVGATTSQNSPDQVNSSGRGILVFINVTAIGTGSITVTIRGRDKASGTYYTILTSLAITANGFTVLRAYPGLTAAANAVASDVLPRVWRIEVTANNANAASYTVSANVIE